MMQNQKPSRRGGWRPLRALKRVVVFLAYDLLHTVNLLGDGISEPEDRPADAERLRRRRRRSLVAPIAAPLIACLRAPTRALVWLASGLRLRWLVSLPAVCGGWLASQFLAFLDNWGLLDDAIDGSSGPVRRLRLALRFVIRSIVRIVPWLRIGAFMLISELLYHLGLMNDGVDVKRVWTRKKTLAVLPAIFAVMLAVVLGIRVASTSSSELIVRYATAAKEAIDADDQALAALWLQRLTKLAPREPVYRYELALALEDLGEADRATALMQTLAPASATGYPHAHLWLARRICELPRPTSADLQLAWRHLRRVLRYNPDSRDVHRLLGQVLVGLGELGGAEEHLKRAAEQDPEMRLLLAAVYAREGKRPQAEQQARAADAGLSKTAAAKTGDVPSRLRMADAKALAGDFAAAEKILSEIEQGRPAGDKPRLAQLYLAWYDSLSRSGGPTGQRRALLEQAIAARPWNLPAIERLLKLAKSSGDDARWARSALEKLDWNTAPAEAHLLLALDQWNSGDRAAALEHMEAAYKTAPDDVRACNNLAWMLAYCEPPDLKRALTLANVALKKAPGQPNLLDTRGQILFKLERWADALRDFEALVVARPDDKLLHERLADCYGALGMSDLADFQRRLASERVETRE